MNKTIKTYDDLCEERDRLRTLRDVQKQRIKDNWESLKEEFGPVRSAFGVIGKMTHADKSNPLLNAGIKAATNLFITKFVLGRAGWVAKLAVPFVVKNYASHAFAEKGKQFFSKIGAFFSRKKDEDGWGQESSEYGGAESRS
jgi:hypothetical protein